MDTGTYKAGMRGATKETKGFQKNLSDIGRAMGAAFSVGAIVAATKKVVGLASEIRHAADNLEISTDEFQGLTAQALRYGVSVEGITKALGKLATSQGKVSEGDKEYIDALKLLNIEQAAFVRASPAEALAMIAKGYAGAENRAEAFSAVSDLVGRSGKNLTAFMKELAEVGLQGVIDKSKEAGQVMSDELITKLELLGTKNEQIILKMQVGWANFLNTVGSAASAIAATAGSIIGDFEGVISTTNKLGLLMAAVNPGGAAAALVQSGALDRATDAGAAAINQGTPELDPEDGMSPKGKKKTPQKTQSEKDAADAKQANGESSARSAQRENEKMRGAMKEGMAKINHDQAVALRDLNDEKEKAQAEGNTALVAAMDERQKILEAQYARDVEDFEAAEQKKRESTRRQIAEAEKLVKILSGVDMAAEPRKRVDDAVSAVSGASNAREKRIARERLGEELASAQKIVDVRDAGQKRIADLEEQRAEVGDSIQGQGNRPSALAQVGGMVGNTRGNLGIKDRQLKIAIEGNKIQQDILRVQQESREAITEIRDAMRPV